MHCGDKVPHGQKLKFTQADVKPADTILVVDDEPAVRTLVSRILTANGFEVVEAANGKEAERVARQFSGSISVLLTDIRIPGINGTGLAAYLLSVYPGLKVVYMSGMVDDAFIRRSSAEPDLYFVAKPFRTAELLKTIRKVAPWVPDAA